MLRQKCPGRAMGRATHETDGKRTVSIKQSTNMLIQRLIKVTEANGTEKKNASDDTVFLNCNLLTFLLHSHNTLPERQSA
jgi:hypothetical protein